MRFVSEEVTRHLVDHELAVSTTRRALIAVADERATLFPVVLGHGWDVGNRFSVKSATSEILTGLKVGSYWHGNVELGLPRHSSCILLFDEQVGRIDAIVQASLANAYRTAAADALAVEWLARPDATRLAVFGAGVQAYFECLAVMQVRPITDIFVVNRDAARADEMAGKLRTNGLATRVLSASDACAQADIIVTATSARRPLFAAEAVRPGTHVSCMGADAVGKQEAPPELLRQAELFCDETAQSYAIGELQHVATDVRAGAVRPAVNLGEVLTGRHPGRQREEAVTVFDSSGLALQDLFLAAALLERAEQAGKVASI
jgi:ornithine cyclodeaminase